MSLDAILALMQAEAASTLKERDRECTRLLIQLIYVLLPEDPEGEEIRLKAYTIVNTYTSILKLDM